MHCFPLLTRMIFLPSHAHGLALVHARWRAPAAKMMVDSLSMACSRVSKSRDAVVGAMRRLPDET